MAQKRNLQDFRKSVAALKKQGVLPASVDARKAQPWWNRTVPGAGGKQRLDKLVDQFDPVLSNKAAALPIDPKKAAEYRKAGFDVVKQPGQKARLIVPHSATEKVTLTKEGHVSIREKQRGITRVQIPVPYNNLEQWLTDAMEKRAEINRLKSKNEFFGFRFYDHRGFYSKDIRVLLEHIANYATVDRAIDSGDPDDMEDVYQHIEILKFDDVSKWTSEYTHRKKQEKARDDWASQYTRKLNKLKKGPKWKLADYHQRNAERQKRWRTKLKGKAKKDYNQSGGKRGTQSKKRRGIREYRQYKPRS